MKMQFNRIMQDSSQTIKPITLEELQDALIQIQFRLFSSHYITLH